MGFLGEDGHYPWYGGTTRSISPLLNFNKTRMFIIRLDVQVRHAVLACGAQGPCCIQVDPPSMPEAAALHPH